MTQTPEEPIDVQRVLMDRAKRLAEADHAPNERPLLPRLVGLGLALLIVVVVLFAFDRFLASMQRFLSLPITDPEPVLTEPLPAYSVPAEEGTFEDRAQPADGQGTAEDAATAVTPAETAPQP
jgi:hypothetical protein